LLAGFIEFLAGFIKLSHTVLLPMCSLLLADCDDTRCEATSRLMALFSGSFCCCFTTIFTVVLTYVISTAKLTACSCAVASWMQSNRLQLNSDKRKFCGVRRRDASTSCPGLRCSSTGPRSTQFSR